MVTGITNFGIFVQLQTYLIDGLIRYEDLLDDWWDVDAKSGQIRGQRSGQTIRIGDVVKTIIVRVDLHLAANWTSRSPKSSEAAPPNLESHCAKASTQIKAQASATSNLAATVAAEAADDDDTSHPRSGQMVPVLSVESVAVPSLFWLNKSGCVLE